MEKDRQINAFQELKIRLFITWKMWQLFHENSQHESSRLETPTFRFKLNPNVNQKQKPFTQTDIGRIARRSMRRQHSDGR